MFKVVTLTTMTPNLASSFSLTTKHTVSILCQNKSFELENEHLEHLEHLETQAKTGQPFERMASIDVTLLQNSKVLLD